MNQNSSQHITRVPADQIGEDQRFNVRYVQLNLENVDDLVRVWLAWKKAPETMRPPPPIKVWDNGSGLVVVDGHHRLSAFRKAFKPTRKHKNVPTPCKAMIDCEVIFGGLAEALIATVRDNRQKQAGLSKSERTNAAWKMVKLTDLSKSQIATNTGVGTSTVARMRKTLERYHSGELKGEPKVTWQEQLETIKWIDASQKILDDDLDGAERNPLTGEARSRFISRAAQQLRCNIRRECWNDDDLLADVLLTAVGERRMDKIIDWLKDGPDLGDQPGDGELF